MFQIKSRIHVMIGTICVMAFALLMMMIHVQINYEPALRELVRVKAAISTTVVTIPLSAFFLFLMKKNYQLTMELQRLANRDRLTDMATRDLFYARMEQNPQAYGVSLMVDIDKFKQINDTFGHPAGDHVISAVARCLHEQTRTEDIVCRYGGEEFVIFLNDRQRDDGYAIAERMRIAIADLALVFEDTKITATVSIGGSMKDRLVDIDFAIKEADAALYRAKQGGRNMTIFADDPITLKKVG